MGTLHSGEGNKAEEQVWVGVRDDLLVGPSYGAGMIGALICWSKSWPGPLGTWRGARLGPEGTNQAAQDRAPGASGAGKWKWFSQMRVLPAGGRPTPSGHGGQRRGPGREPAGGRPLTPRGGMRAGLRAACVRLAASLYLARPGSYAGQLEGPTMATWARARRGCHRRHRLALGSRLQAGGPRWLRPRRALRQGHPGRAPGGPAIGPALTSPETSLSGKPRLPRL